MAITIDSVVVDTNSSISTWNRTNTTVAGGSNRRFIVGVIIEDASAAVVQSVTINGQPLTQDVREIISSGFSAIAEVWSIGEAALPVAGNYTLSVVCDITVGEIAVFICNANGVKDQDAEATTGNNATNVTSISDTITTLTDDALIYSVCITGDGGRTLTPTQGGQTLQGQADMSSCEGAVSTQITTTAGNYTHGFTGPSQSNRMAIALAAYEKYVESEPTTPQVVDSFTGSSTGTTLDITVDVNSYSNRVFGAFITSLGSNSTNNAISSVVLDPGGYSVSLTQAFTQQSGLRFGWNARSSVWYMLDSAMPTPGSYTLRITSAGTPRAMLATVMSLRSTKQEAPFATAGTGTIISTSSISTNINTSPNSTALLVDVDTVYGTDQTGTSGAGQTTTADLFTTYTNHFTSYKTVSSIGTYPMSWNFSGTTWAQAHSVVAFAVAPITAIEHYATWFGGGF